MKITVKPKQEEKRENIPFDKILVGYVYIAERFAGPTMLKLRNDEAVLLSLNNGGNIEYFEIAKGYKGVSAYKILGKLTEIIVKEE